MKESRFNYLCVHFEKNQFDDQSKKSTAASPSKSTVLFELRSTHVPSTAFVIGEFRRDPHVKLFVTKKYNTLI